MTTTVHHNADYTISRHDFETTRKAELIAQSLFGHPEVRLVDPAEYVEQTLRHLAEVHDDAYLEAVRTGAPRWLAESQGFDWDPGIWAMVVAHAAGQVAAVNRLLVHGDRVSGSLSSGQHHARRDTGAGFCTLNGLAASTLEAIRLGAGRVLVLDFDAHGGGGTRSLTDPERVVQVDVTVSPFDTWEPTTDDDYFAFADTWDYLEAIEVALDHASGVPGVDLVIYNAGMDPANAGVSADDLAVREQTVFEWVSAERLPVSYLLAGGYLWGGVSWDELVALHRLTVDTFVN